MENKSDFDLDLRQGEIGERRVRYVLRDPNLEVKRDRWICKTGNLAIEYKSREKPSGIAITKANWWAFVVSGEVKDKVIILVETGRLREICREYYKLGKIKKMGDENSSEAVLVPINELVNEKRP